MAKPAIPSEPLYPSESLPAQSPPNSGLPLKAGLVSPMVPKGSVAASSAPAQIVHQQIMHQMDQAGAGDRGTLAAPAATQIAPPLPPSPQQLAHRQFEQQTMQDVQLLLETMFERENSTLKLVLDRLYEIGAINLVNQRVPNHCLNQIARWIARCSRPVGKLLIMRWFKRNCPRLISHWLYNQVKFESKQIASRSTESTHLNSTHLNKAASSTEVESYRRQVQQLNSRVRLLTILLIGVTFTLGGSLAWAVWQQSAWQIRPQADSHPTRNAAQSNDL